ncbi:TrmB family transcriptional regulator [Mesorhizobium sp. B1-1-7]|uniref:TrmB family transcriptional regulator n=1 Tax=Mesorhizobium sp. B1-1-7 TaxID=2589977 RepID=UPI0011296BFE|nr:TrmB family transcriptional regulator [Mesorhizobium sp. B1-1-7]TPN44890.1 TrmB family transcriptional regulator [Mesorhizobium sp. B1-1-7]
MGGSLSAPEPAGIWYRFSVKCDRPTNAAIEMAAKAAGVSASVFVQRHFEVILDDPERVVPVIVAPPLVPKIARSARADVDLSASLGITMSALRVYRALDERVDRARNVAITNSDLADAAGVARPRVPDMVASLRLRGLVQTFDRKWARAATRYHVFSIGDDR